jgi:hypothetical protein
MDTQPIVTPEAGKDYPRNWNEFLDWFGSEGACPARMARDLRQVAMLRTGPPPIPAVGHFLSFKRQEDRATTGFNVLQTQLIVRAK